MLLTISDTSIRRVFPVFLLAVGILLFIFSISIGYPINIICLVFFTFFYFFAFFIKKIGIYYKLEDLYYEDESFFISKLDKPFKVSDVESIEELKKIDVTKITLNNGTIYYVIFSTAENKTLLSKD
ncbi:hypothetical protein LZQ00_10000 [Sphingobacterium sp. SRCM116780]|uniref:hypothetical protein n=1 Tax=Sphingobacterium sp. SRCM116780 TaxID=2907623 RepID=UPI001F38C8AA|nr:hypothetical protein [Sphingobacterium sp. SRCM116780]UIR54606.1 hypothetical protein LZQ00_10000 [Sphingobacterium sp. SRCM116780]